jgi:outer membrane protein insertion porin family
MKPKPLATVALTLFLLASQNIFAADAKEIRKIEIKGNRRIESDAIRAKLRTKVGAAVDSGKLKDDVQSIYSMGYFRDVNVYFDDKSQTLTLDVREKTVISKIDFVGNDKIDDDDLKKEVNIKAFSYLDQNAIRENVEKIRRLYDKKGFYLASIDPQLVEKANNEAELNFKIVENTKVQVRQINFIGNKVFPDDELKGIIRTKEKGFFSFLTDSGTYQNEMLDQDRQILRDYYGHKGYIKAKVSPPRVQLTTDKKSLTLTFVIEEGDAYNVGKVDLDGEFVIPAEELRKKVKLKEREVADTFLIQQDLMTLSTAYADEGYAYANVIPRDRYDEDRKIVDITYFFQPGQKVFIERIEFKGHESTRDKVLRREMRIMEGDQYSATKIRESKQNIERLALYEEVKVSTPRGTADNKVNIVVEIKEKPTGTFSIGAGFNTLESFQVIGQITKRNLFGLGTDLQFDARFGGKTQAFNLQYRDEYFLDTRFGLTVNAFNMSRRWSNFDVTSRGGNIGLDYPLYVQGLRRVRAGVTYNLSDEILTDIRPTVEALFEGGITSSMTGRITYDTRNRVFEPSKGSFLELSEQMAGGYLGGANNFSKLEWDGRWFFPAADESSMPIIGGSVFALHLNLGYVAPLSDGERVPLFERYFPGGILSLRGFPIRSLGPEIQIASSSDPTGLISSDFAVGGNKQIIFNAEYIFPIIRPANIKGVIFFDMGNAFDNGESMFTLAGQRQSGGFGIRWFSPIGPLRFEWGFPLDRKEKESTVVFDFTIGSLF